VAGSNGVQTRVNASTSDGIILAANGARSNASIYNDSSAYLRLLMQNATSSATAFTVVLNPSEYYELPVCYNGASVGVYTGVVKGNWSAAIGAANVTEYS
jgi:hypothetical protein